MDRADKIISNLLVLSRSDARRMIKTGRVVLNGKKLKAFDIKVDENDILSVDGKRLEIKQKVYYVLNKPTGVVCDDKSKDVYAPETLPESFRRKDLFCVGRLDKDTTGLLIITNDGDFAHRVLSPKKHILKRYLAKLCEPLSEESAKKIKSGLVLSDGTVLLPAQVQTVSEDKKTVIIGIFEGKYHQIKRMAGAVGNKVISLSRISVGALTLEQSLAIGEAMEITAAEAENIFQ